MQKVTEDEIAQRKGFVFIKNLSGYDLYTHFDRLLERGEMALLREIFPAKMKSFHVCAGSGKWVVDLVLPVMKQIAGKYIRLRTICHVGSKTDMLREMKRYHMVPENQSVILGGDIAYSHFLSWLNVQQALEDQHQIIIKEKMNILPRQSTCRPRFFNNVA